MIQLSTLLRLISESDTLLLSFAILIINNYEHLIHLLALLIFIIIFIGIINFFLLIWSIL